MSDDPRWLRATLDPAPVPPPDLADRAERTARGIVRRRTAAAALTVAALVAVPFAVQGARAPDRTAGPNPTATAPASPAPCPPRDTRPSRSARTAADVAWPYRGDPALKAAAQAAARSYGLTDARPLFGTRLPDGHSMYAVAGRGGSGWQLLWTTERGGGAGYALPVLGPDTQLSLLEQSGPPVDGVAGYLLVLAAPGTTGIAFTSCPADGARRYEAAGDTAVLLLEPRHLKGTIEVRGPAGWARLGSWNVASGGPGAYPIDPLPVPDGYREVPEVVEDARTVSYRGSATLEDARVLVRCRTRSGRLALAVGGPPAQARCDGTVRVVAEGLTIPAGTRLVDIPTDYRDFPRVEVLVVVPDR